MARKQLIRHAKQKIFQIDCRLRTTQNLFFLYINDSMTDKRICPLICARFYSAVT